MNTNQAIEKTLLIAKKLIDKLENLDGMEYDTAELIDGLVGFTIEADDYLLEKGYKVDYSDYNWI